MADFGTDIEFKENGIIRNRAAFVLNKAKDLLKEIEGLGLFATLEKGIFADIKRSEDGGKKVPFAFLINPQSTQGEFNFI